MTCTCSVCHVIKNSLKFVLASAGISEKVGTKPVGVEVLGQKLVLFRGSDGTVHCLHGMPSSARCTLCCPAPAQRARVLWAGVIARNTVLTCRMLEDVWLGCTGGSPDPGVLLPRRRVPAPRRADAHGLGGERGRARLRGVPVPRLGVRHGGRAAPRAGRGERAREPGRPRVHQRVPGGGAGAPALNPEPHLWSHSMVACDLAAYLVGGRAR